MDSAKLPVSLINSLDSTFDVAIDPYMTSTAKQKTYDPQDNRFDLELPLDPVHCYIHALDTFVAHFLCLAIKARYALIILLLVLWCCISKNT